MEDRRIRKSKKALKEALCKLVEEKPLSDISITELCLEADINRMTFYKNYGTIKEVVKEIYFDYFDEMIKMIPDDRHTDEKGTELSIECIRFFKENYKRMAALTNNYEDKMFLGMMIEHYMQKRKVKETDILKRYSFVYETMGSFTILTGWLAEGCPISEEQLAQFIMKMSDAVESIE